ncbi:hypothetical protein CPC08DRAFT_769576 [Agrocybe pediades]|nr:hypothetical protein CPC08DRAFT_769576 [Agrocybe pediades]
MQQASSSAACHNLLIIDPNVSFNPELEFGELLYPQSVYTTPQRLNSASVPSDTETDSSESYNILVPPTLRPATWPSRSETALSEEPDSDPPSPMSENQPPQQTAAPAATMPAKNHSSAPKFDGKAANLQVFLDEVEALAKACKLSPKETIEWAIC